MLECYKFLHIVYDMCHQDNLAKGLYTIGDALKSLKPNMAFMHNNLLIPPLIIYVHTHCKINLKFLTLIK